ncbi:MAG: hypothetical protein R3F54_14330 [Alphaproteobacteria bacterium]
MQAKGPINRFRKASLVAALVPIVLGVAAGRSYVALESDLTDRSARPARAADSLDQLERGETRLVDSSNESATVPGVPEEALRALKRLEDEAGRFEEPEVGERKTAVTSPGVAATQPGMEKERIPPVSTDSKDSVSKAEMSKEDRPANILAILMAEQGGGARVHEPANTDARVIVRARSIVPVQILSRSGDYLWSETMQPGDMVLVPNRDDLELWTTSATQIELLLDGKALPPLGLAGAIVSNLSLSPDALARALADAGVDEKLKPTF